MSLAALLLVPSSARFHPGCSFLARRSAGRAALVWPASVLAPTLRVTLAGDGIRPRPSPGPSQLAAAAVTAVGVVAFARG